MMGRLTGKVAVITGAANGMGSEHARRLVSEGAQVIMTDINKPSGLELAQSLGESALFVHHDVTNAADWHRVVAAAQTQYGGIDILINNAGLFSSASIAEESESKFRTLIDVNVVGTWLGIQCVSPVLEKRMGGSIINIASIAAIRGMRNYAAYGCTKAAICGLTRHAAVELGPKAIRVNAVLPGAVDSTGMYNSSDLPEKDRELRRTTPLQRTGTCREVSSLIVYLASDDARFTTGVDHVIDGGRSI